jgi:hypothetical protein
MRKENITDAFLAADYRFFPPMDTDGSDIESCTAFAIAQFFCKPVGMAFAGTKVAIMQYVGQWKKGCKIHE